MWPLIFWSPLIPSAILYFGPSDQREMVKQLLDRPPFQLLLLSGRCFWLLLFHRRGGVCPPFSSFLLFHLPSILHLLALRRWEDIPECPRLFRRLSRANQPVLDCGEEKQRGGRGGGQSRRRGGGTQRPLWTSGGLGSSGGGAVRGSCAALRAAADSSMASLSCPRSRSHTENSHTATPGLWGRDQGDGWGRGRESTFDTSPYGSARSRSRRQVAQVTGSQPPTANRNRGVGTGHAPMASPRPAV